MDKFALKHRHMRCHGLSLSAALGVFVASLALVLPVALLPDQAAPLSPDASAAGGGLASSSEASSSVASSLVLPSLSDTPRQPTWHATAVRGATSAVANSTDSIKPAATSTDSNKLAETSTDTVYLVPQSKASFAFAAGSAADGPVFVVPKRELSEDALTYLQEHQPQRVVLIGSWWDMPQRMLKPAKQDFTVDRIKPKSLTRVSVKVAEQSYDHPEIIYLVREGVQGVAPDAIGAGARGDGPVLLIPTGKKLPGEVRRYLDANTQAKVIQVGAEPFPQVDLSAILAGRDRVTTSGELAADQEGKALVIANGSSQANLTQALNVKDQSVLLAAPDSLPAETCAHIFALQPSTVQAVEGSDAVSASVLEHAKSCLKHGWQTSGYKLRDIDEDFYAADRMSYTSHEDQAVCDKMMKLGGKEVCAPDGVRIIRLKGVQQFNYTSISQLGLYNLAEYKTKGTPRFLQRAVTQGNALIHLAEKVDGELWLPYDYDYALNGEAAYTIKSPWHSSMAQGQALSLLSRLSQLQPEEPKWAKARDQIFATFKHVDRYPEPFTLSFDREGHLWFEEFAGSTPPLRVPNGHMFAIFGLYDYWRVTKDPAAAELLDAGITTIRDSFDIYRNPGEMSSYCTKMPRCRPIVNMKYHAIHAMQLHYMFLMTGDEELQRQSDTLFEDYHEINEEKGWGLVW